jgi:hypothetical protein
MPKQPSGHMIVSFFFALFLGLTSASAKTNDKPRISQETLVKFFQYYEDRDYAKAISLLPLQVRDLSPYEKGKENLPPYKRDEGIYFDIMQKTSGEKPLPKQDPSDKEIQYYLGVMHYWMNNLDMAKQKFLLCLQLDPTYRMAHVYLFRIFSKLESELLSKIDNRSEDIGALLIEKLGFGTSDSHLDMASELLKKEENQSLPVLRVSCLFDKSVLKDLRANASTAPDPENRGTLNDEMKPGQYRLESITQDRHCLDEAYFLPEQKLFWDGIDKNGKMTGGSEVTTTFSVSQDLVMPQKAKKVIIYNPSGKKVAELPIDQQR